MKIYNKRELQSIATSNSADMDYKGFMKIYKKGTSKPYSFLTIDNITLSAKDLLRLRKKIFNSLIKMTLTDELKLLMARLKQIKINMVQTEKQLNFCIIIKRTGWI